MSVNLSDIRPAAGGGNEKVELHFSHERLRTVERSNGN